METSTKNNILAIISGTLSGLLLCAGLCVGLWAGTTVVSPCDKKSSTPPEVRFIHSDNDTWILSHPTTLKAGQQYILIFEKSE